MAGGWLDITDASGARRESLRKGLTRVGGGDADVELANTGSDQLHIWDMPPRAVFVGSGAAPLLDGRPVDEVSLRPGARILWGGATLTYGGDAAGEDVARLEEIPLPAFVAAAVAERDGAAGLGLTDSERRVWTRLQACVLVDLGLTDRAAIKRWQQEVVAGRLEVDRCAAELVALRQGSADDPRVLERAGRLLRDFLMAPLMTGVRGASRRAKRAAQGGLAFVIAQGLALLVFLLIGLVALLLLRIKDVSIDALLDRVLLR